MVDMRFAYDIFTIPPKINMPPEEGPFQKEMNHLPNISFHGICEFSEGCHMFQVIDPQFDPMFFCIQLQPLRGSNTR